MSSVGESIKVNGSLQTSAAHIYAAGDVTDAPARVEMTAGHEGTLAAANALTGTQHAIDYDTVPYTVFTDPQLAGVGLTEDQQMERLGVCACRTMSLENVPKALIVKRPAGLIKMAILPENRADYGRPHSCAPCWRARGAGGRAASESEHGRRTGRVPANVSNVIRRYQAVGNGI
jgi:mercuric reductase